jgi:hypothetical protein
LSGTAVSDRPSSRKVTVQVSGPRVDSGHLENSAKYMPEYFCSAL